MPNTKPPFWLGVVAAGAAVALTTLLVYPLKPVAADISLSVVYLLAVLFVASLWGLWLAIATAFVVRDPHAAPSAAEREQLENLRRIASTLGAQLVVEQPASSSTRSSASRVSAGRRTFSWVRRADGAASGG